MKDFSVLLKHAEMLLSTEAFYKIVSIIENDQNCIIDIGLKGEPGEPGQSSQEQGNNDCILYQRIAGISSCRALDRLYCEEDGRCTFYKSGSWYDPDGKKKTVKEKNWKEDTENGEHVL